MKGKLNLLLFVMMLMFSSGLLAQRNISAPVLEGNRECATLVDQSADLVTALLSPGDALPNNNQFILQLSDVSGSFADPDAILELSRIDGPNNGTSAEQELRFENIPIPQDLAGSDNYRLRIISSTNANIISTESQAYPIYYFSNNWDFRINRGESLVFCDVTSFERTVEIYDRLGVGQYELVDPDLYTWNWYKDGNLIAGANESSLTITSEGRYYAEVALGGCIPSYTRERTNDLTVELLTDAERPTILSSGDDFSFCPNDQKRLSTADRDFTLDYIWTKDGQVIEGAIFPEIILPDNNFAGEYIVSVVYGADCTKESLPVTVENEGSSITTPLPEFLVLIPQQNLTLEVTTDAPIGSPYRWTVDNSPLESGTLSGTTISIEASIVARYRIEIDANDQCNSKLFSATDVLSPTGFDIEIGTDDDVDCTADVIPIQLLEMFGRTSAGPVPLTEDQLDLFDFEWFKDGVSTGETSLLLNITRSDAGGVYQLRANLRTGQAVGQNIESNPLPITFLENDIVLGIDPPILQEGGSVILTAPFDDSFTYQWYEVVGGEGILIENETGNTLEVFEEGDFYAVISAFCPVQTQTREVRRELPLAAIIPNIVSPNGDGINDNWILPEEFTNDPSVEVTIFNQRGVVDASVTNYQNDWPQQISSSQGEDPIYYFIISKNNEVVRKGSITVMK